MPKSSPLRMIIAPEINKTIPRAYFDKASQGEPSLGGGGVVYLTENEKIEVKFAPCRASNNKELSALWVVFKIAINKQLKKLQLLGDSKMVIEWANGKIQINAPHLQHLLTTIKE